MQKLHTLQLEAPITKVIMLLSIAVTDTINPETAAQIDKVRLIEMLVILVMSVQLNRYMLFAVTSSTSFTGNRYPKDDGTLHTAS